MSSDCDSGGSAGPFGPLSLLVDAFFLATVARPVFIRLQRREVDPGGVPVSVRSGEHGSADKSL